MILTIVAVVARHLICVFSEDALQHFDWKVGMTSFPKNWLAYVEHVPISILKKKSLKNIQQISFLWEMKQSTGTFKSISRKQFSLKPESVTCMFTNCVCNATQFVRSPLSSIVLSSEFWSSCLEKHIFGMKLDFLFFFRFHHEFWLNMSFKCVNILDVSGHCFDNFLKVQAGPWSESQYFFLLCGFHSEFDIYIPFPRAGFGILVRWLETADADIDVSVYSKHVVSSEYNHHLISPLEPQFVHTFQNHTQSMHTYHISVKMYQLVQTTVSAAHDHKLFYFDGPGYFSRKYIFQGTIAVNSSTQLKDIRSFSTFQCLIQLLFPLYHNIQNPLLSYAGHPRLLKDIQLKTDHRFDVEFSEESCDQNTSFCAFHFRTLPAHILKIVVKYFSFSGPISRNCAFGGTALFEVNINGNSTQLLQLCSKFQSTKSNYWPLPRGIHTNTSEAKLILFSTHKYSFLKTVLEVSHSTCLLIRKTPCKLKYFRYSRMPKDPAYFVNLQRNRCIEIEISSGQYHPSTPFGLVGPEDTLTHEVLKHCFKFINHPVWHTCLFKLIFPHCEPLTLKFFPPSMQENSVIFSTETYLHPSSLFVIESDQTDSLNGTGIIQGWTQSKDNISPHNTTTIENSLEEVVALWKNRTIMHQEHPTTTQPNMKQCVFYSLKAKFQARASETTFQTQVSFLLGTWFHFGVQPILVTNKDGFILPQKHLVKTYQLKAQFHFEGSLYRALVLFEKALDQSSGQSLQIQLKTITSTLSKTQHFTIDKTQQYLPNFQVRMCVYSLHAQKPKTLFAVPWKVGNFTLKVLNSKPTEPKKLLFYWIRGFRIPEPQQKVLKKQEQIDLHLKRGNYHFLKINYGRDVLLTTFSWIKAGQYCRKVTGHLPRIFSRNENDDFVTLLKVSEPVLVSTAVYIDLSMKLSRMRWVTLQCCFASVIYGGGGAHASIIP